MSATARGTGRNGGAVIDGSDRADGQVTSAMPSPAPSWFRTLDATSLILIGLCRPDGTFLDANRLAFDDCGFAPEKEVGKPFWDTGWWAGSSRVRAQVRRWCEQVADGGPPVRALTPYFLADGSERLVDFTLQLVTDDQGRRFLLPTGLDITERVAAERTAAEAEGLRAVADARAGDLAAVRAAEARLSAALQRSARILDHVADGIYGLDAHGRVEFANPAAARTTGHTQEALLGQDQHALIHAHRRDGSYYPVAECPVWRALQTGQTVVAESETFWRADGTPLPIELVAVPAVEDGVVMGVVVSFRDLTDRLAAQRQAMELQRLSEQAAAQRALSDRLQEALLTPPPELGDLRVAVRYRPATHDVHVGGDWYDSFVQPDGATVLTIGDVVGHGSAAAAAMGQLRGLLRSLAYGSEEPLGDTVTRMERVAQGLAVSALATVVLARIELAEQGVGGRLVRWSSAGHLPPLLLSPEGETVLLETRPELMLGIDPDAPRSEHRVVLPDGWTLLLFTDGLVERPGVDLDDGLEALRAAAGDLGRASLDELCDTVLERLVPRAAGDDIALLAVRAA